VGVTETDLASAPRRRLLYVALVAAVVAAMSVLWLWRHPSQGFAGGYGLDGQRQVGHTLWTTLVHSGRPGADEVTITGLEPRVRLDGSRAAVEYVICELDPTVLDKEGVGSFGYGGSDRDLKRYCARTRPAVGATFRLRSEPPEELLVGVTPTRPGRTVITGHRISFRVGWQVGSDDIGVTVKLRARPRTG
jgi:hypothetical protein